MDKQELKEYVDKLRTSGRNHGLSRTRTYKSWSSMIDRCYNNTQSNVEYYKERGIKVCDRWNSKEGGNFLNFLEDMGFRPDGMTLDRIDVNGNYEPSNCRWADGTTQCFNTRVYKNNSDKKVGVYWHKKNKRWWSEINFKGTVERLYYGLSYDDAVKAREAAELKYYGYNKE